MAIVLVCTSQPPLGWYGIVNYIQYMAAILTGSNTLSDPKFIFRINNVQNSWWTVIINANKWCHRCIICPVQYRMLDHLVGDISLAENKAPQTFNSQFKNMVTISTRRTLFLPARSESGIHLVFSWLENHAKLALQTGQRVARWDRKGEAL